MRTVTYKLADLKKAVIHLGKVAENDATRVRIDAAEIFGDYPEAQVALSVTNPVGEKYPATVQRDGDFVVWDVKDSSLTAEGDGEIQIRFSQSGAKIRSEVGKTKICRSIIGEGETPDPVQDWLDEAEDVLEDVEEALGAFPTGGTTGQVLAKKSDADFDTEWVDQGSGGTTDYTELTNKPQIGGVTLTGDKSLHDLGAAAESDIPDVSGFYTKPAGGIPASDIAAGVIPDPAALIDDTAGEGDTDKTWSADKLTSDVLSAIDKSPEVRLTDKSGVDLDITDVSGDVLVRLANGHVQTKKFNSEDVSNIVETTAGSDLDITDENGNVVARLENGHIRTKYFESRVRSRMKFGAHNGAEWYAPECTVPAYRIAGQQGWEWAWIAGIDFSTDGTMYVIHDDTVDRTTDGTGYLNQMSDAQINELNIDIENGDYRLSDFDPSELKIPTLEQVVQQCVRYDMKMVMRLHLFPKNYDTAENMAKWDGLMEIINGYGIQPEDISCYVGTGDHATTCRTLIGENVEISTFLGNAAIAQDFVDWFDDRSITGKRAAIISISNVDANAVKLLHSNGIRVYAYGYNPSDTVVSNMASLGVDILQNGKAHKLNN